jgi:hypothetical protein
MESKSCCKCNETKPLSEFHLNRRNTDGRHSYCKVCNIRQTRIRNEREKELKAQARAHAKQQWEPIGITEKLCPSCKLTKLTADFQLISRRTDGLAKYCRDCSKRSLLERKTKLGEAETARKPSPRVLSI